MTITAELADGTKLEFPDGTQEAVIQRVVKSMTAPKDETSTGIGGIAENVAKGFSDKAIGAIGGIPDLVASGMRGVGLPAPAEGYYTDALHSGYNALGRAMDAPISAMIGRDQSAAARAPTMAEKIAYGFGSGAGDAATFIVPGAALARMAPAGSLAANVGRAAAASPAMQVAGSALGGGVSEATDSNAAGLAAALALPLAAAAGRRIVTPVGRQLAPEEQRLANLAEQNGIRLTAGQATGSVPLRAAESSFTQLPFTAGPQHAIYDGQREAFNRMVLQNADVNATRASPEVLDDAFRTLGTRFDNLVAATPQVNITPRVAAAVEAAATDYGRRLQTDVQPVFQSYVDDFTAMTANLGRPGVNAVSVDGPTYQRIASGLRTAVRAYSRNPPLRDALLELQNAIDGAMEQSTTPRLARAWRETRNHYRNLLQIDSAMASAPATDAVAGNIPFGALKEAVKSADRPGFARGRGDLNDAARIGQLLASMKIPDSGTAQRSRMINLLTGGAGGAGLGAVVTGADPVSTALAVGGSLAIPRGIQAAMNTPTAQRYLRNNMLPPGGPGGTRQQLANLLMEQELGNMTER